MNPFSMKTSKSLISIILVLFSFSLYAQDYDTLWLSSLDLSSVMQEWGSPGKDRTVDGNPLTIAGKVYSRGVGTHANSRVSFHVNGGLSLHIVAGVDDEANHKDASVVYELYGDNQKIWESPVMRMGDEPAELCMEVKDFKMVTLAVNDGGNGINYDHADWADAYFIYYGEPPAILSLPKKEAVILTPEDGNAPQINGPEIYGVRPGSPFLYTIPVSGKKPVRYDMSGLPAGLKIDYPTGQITGVIDEAGEYKVNITVTNAFGSDTREFTIVVGDKIALTPPLGWNSWNCHGCAMDEAKVKAAADAMVASGLADHGWTYINIDDCWMVKSNSDDPVLGGDPRDTDGNIKSNGKFPDMKALCDYVHSKGLKIGIYTSPGPQTCAGYTGSYTFEDKDARQFAGWGIDYIKYDWCSYGQIAKDQGIEELKKPYSVMHEALKQVNRDIVYSLCQYGMGKVWEWGAEVGGNCWRTTGDITDTWSSMSGIGFSQSGYEAYAGPGHWNDPDMLVVGSVGWGPQLHPTRLTPDEQYTHISLWSLLASPLLIGCDLSNMDDFTKNLLTNDEVIAINQDPLGNQAKRVKKDGDMEIWVKELKNDELAVGFFNRGWTDEKIKIDWNELGISGTKVVRDVWRQKEVGEFESSFQTMVSPHGSYLFKISAKK